MKLVLLPGLDGTGVLFRPLLAALPPNIEPVVISYPTQTPLSYDQLLPLVAGALPNDDPYVLLGESFGGPLSLRIASASPRGLRGIVLAGSFVSCPFDFVPQWTRHLVHPWPFRAFPLLIRLKSQLGVYETGEHSSLSMEAISQVAPQVFAHRIREIIRVDVTNELRDCNVPMLYLQGQYDLVVPQRNLRRIQALKPTIHSIRIRSSHMILKTQPVAAAQAIAEFLQRHC